MHSKHSLLIVGLLSLIGLSACAARAVYISGECNRQIPERIVPGAPIAVINPDGADGGDIDMAAKLSALVTEEGYFITSLSDAEFRVTFFFGTEKILYEKGRVKYLHFVEVIAENAAQKPVWRGRATIGDFDMRDPRKPLVKIERALKILVQYLGKPGVQKIRWL